MKNLLAKFKIKHKKPPKMVSISSPVNPHKHWIILLRAFFAVFIFLIVFSLYLLYEIKNEQIFQASPGVKDGTNSLKEDLLKKVNESFSQKAQKESELKINPPLYKDPSI